MILKLQDLVNENRWVVFILNMTLKIFFYRYFCVLYLHRVNLFKKNVLNWLSTMFKAKIKKIMRLVFRVTQSPQSLFCFTVHFPKSNSFGVHFWNSPSWYHSHLRKHVWRLVFMIPVWLANSENTNVDENCYPFLLTQFALEWNRNVLFIYILN